MKLVSLDWKPADSAYGRGQQAYIEFGQALAKLVAEGATQEQVAERYDMDQEGVSKAITVGKDLRIMAIGHKSLPKSTRSLYYLTTLDDKGFAELAKPATTRAKIEEYKRRLAPPQEPTVEAPRKPIVPPRVNPPAGVAPPVVEERITPEQAREMMEDLMANARGQRGSVEPRSQNTVAGALKAFGIHIDPQSNFKIELQSLDILYRGLTSKYFPDKPGGNLEKQTALNTSRITLMEKALWNAK